MSLRRLLGEEWVNGSNRTPGAGPMVVGFGPAAFGQLGQSLSAADGPDGCHLRTARWHGRAARAFSRRAGARSVHFRDRWPAAALGGMGGDARRLRSALHRPGLGGIPA